MRIQFERVHLKRLLKNSPKATSICIDTTDNEIMVADDTGRELGFVKVPIHEWNPGIVESSI